jgi:hypothetical protein
MQKRECLDLRTELSRRPAPVVIYRPGLILHTECDLHDDNLLGLQVVTPRKRNELATIRVDLRDDTTGIKKTLALTGCANVRWSMDFDVLADNWFAQTAAFKIDTDLGKLKLFVKTQRRHWRVRYMPPSSPEEPIRRKMASIRSFRLFQITFRGGTLEVLAKHIRIRNTGRRA